MAEEKILLAYVDGSDLHGVADDLFDRFCSFVKNRVWKSEDCWAVNQIHDGDPTLAAGDLPDWELGLNLRLSRCEDDNDWFEDVKAILDFLSALNALSGREFVMEIGDSASGFTTHIAFVGGKRPKDALVRERIEHATWA